MGDLTGFEVSDVDYIFVILYINWYYYEWFDDSWYNEWLWG